MKQMLKRRIAIMLSLLFVLPNVLGLLPMATLQTQAEVVLSWSIPNSNLAVEVEEGKTFYVGDYVTYNFGGSLSKMKASYKSSNKTVATVDKNGCMKTLKPGTTTITVTYKGKKLSREFQVVKKGTFADVEGIAAVTAAAQKFPSQMPSKITTKNGIKYLRVLSDHSKAVAAANKKISVSGLLCEEVTYGSSTSYTTTNKLVVPESGRRNLLKSLLEGFYWDNPLTSSSSAKAIRFSSATASAKNNTMKLKFKNKVTKAHILSAKYKEEIMYGDEFNASELPDNQAYLRITVRKNNKSYVGMAKIIQGKKTATAQLFSSSVKDNKTVYKKHKMKKGEKYVLSSGWLMGKKVKVFTFLWV